MSNYVNTQDFSKSQIAKLSSILNDFYQVTGIKICVFDANEVEIAYAPQMHCDFCKYVHESKKGSSLCDQSLAHAFNECKKTKQMYFYHCDMGLVECVSPIYQLNNLIGFIMIGQFVDQPSDDEEERVKKLIQQLKACGLNVDKGIELMKGVPVCSVDKINASISILETCASYIYLNKLLSEQSSFVSKINGYIRKNIESNITVDDLCKSFNVSIMELYYLCNNFFKMTPAKYIKKTRLDIACELILDKNIRISEIAYRVGICDYNYFSKIFKKEFGISPTEYRRLQKNK